MQYFSHHTLMPAAAAAANASDCNNHASIADVVCSAFERPVVAFFLAGAARTIAQPLLYRSIRSNLVEAFGGDITFLAYIKLLDKRGDRNPKVNARIDPPEASVRAALAHIAAAMARSHIKVVRLGPPSSCPVDHGFHE